MIQCPSRARPGRAPGRVLVWESRRTGSSGAGGGPCGPRRIGLRPAGKHSRPQRLPGGAARLPRHPGRRRPARLLAGRHLSPGGAGGAAPGGGTAEPQAGRRRPRGRSRATGERAGRRALSLRWPPPRRGARLTPGPGRPLLLGVAPRCTARVDFKPERRPLVPGVLQQSTRCHLSRRTWAAVPDCGVRWRLPGGGSRGAGSEACGLVPTVQEISQSLSGQEKIGKLPLFKGS